MLLDEGATSASVLQVAEPRDRVTAPQTRSGVAISLYGLN